MTDRSPIGYRVYFVLLSHLVFMVAAADRAVLSLLVEPIRRDLGLTDLQVSLLGGLAFSLFYAVAAIPIGWLIDNFNRILVLFAGILLWSVATIGSAFATVFSVLFLLRVLVAIGETTTSCSIGIVTDMFIGRALARMVVVTMLGASFGAALALVGGGVLFGRISGQELVQLPLGLALRPWQFVFLCAGLPGLLLALLLLLTTHEVPRRRLLVDADGRQRPVKIRGLLTFLRAHRAAVSAHAIGYSVWSIADKSLAFWAPTYLVRAHGLAVGEAGVLFGTMALLIALVGNPSVGWLVDRMARRGCQDAAMRIGRNLAVAGIIPICAFPFVTGLPAAVSMLVLALLAQCGYSTVVVAQQMLAPNQVRAQYTAVYLLISNLIGGVIGLSAVAWLSEHVLEDRGLVGVSMAIVCGAGTAAAALILSTGLSHYRHSMAVIDRQTDAAATGTA